jgi:hypothetical protein
VYLSHGLPADLSQEYFLLTPPHVESCFTTSAPSFGGCSAGEPLNIAAYCAYHQNTATTTMVLYANMPFDATNPLWRDGNYPNGLISDGEINGGLAHEHDESVTTRSPTTHGPTVRERIKEKRSVTSALARWVPRSAPPPRARLTTR